VGRQALSVSSDPEERWTIGLAMRKMAVSSEISMKATSFSALY